MKEKWILEVWFGPDSFNNDDWSFRGKPTYKQEDGLACFYGKSADDGEPMEISIVIANSAGWIVCKEAT